MKYVNLVIILSVSFRGICCFLVYRIFKFREEFLVIFILIDNVSFFVLFFDKDS